MEMRLLEIAEKARRLYIHNMDQVSFKRTNMADYLAWK